MTREELMTMISRLYGFAMHYGDAGAVEAGRDGLFAQALALIEEFNNER